VYRAIQEIMNNAIKHSGANQIDIIFTRQDSGLQIIIKDKGKGFDKAILNNKRKKSNGFGLFAVKERVENLQGSIIINSAPGLGTEVKIFVPLITNKLL
jgi:two-component system sensor histidine kinase DegS